MLSVWPNVMPGSTASMQDGKATNRDMRKNAQARVSYRRRKRKFFAEETESSHELV